MDPEQNPYAPPRDAFEPHLPDDGRERPLDEGPNVPWQKNGLCVVRRTGSEFPDRCVICNRPADFKLRRTLWWHPGAYYLLLLVCWLGYVIAALSVRKSATVDFGLCEVHRRRQHNGTLLLRVGVGASIAVFVVGTLNGSPPFLFVGLAGVIACGIAGRVASAVGSVDHMDEENVWLKLGPRFVHSLPGSRTDHAPHDTYEEEAE